MKILGHILRLITVLLILSIYGWSLPGLNPNSGQTINRLIIQFKPGTSAGHISCINSALGDKILESIPQLGVQVIEVKAGQESNRTRAYRQYSEVSSVEIDITAEAVEIPYDTHFNEQWGITKVQCQQAWEITKGSRDVKIAIVDSGIDLEHPDLASKIIASANFSYSDTADDRRGHGTHVAGIAAAITANGDGIAGMGYDTSLINVKVLNDNGSGYYSQIARGITWAVDNGADIINLSLAGSTYSGVLQEAIDYAWNKGALIVVAAGNSNSEALSYPACYERCIAVAATDETDQLYYFSNYGDWIDVAAPGSAYSTTLDGGYCFRMGTSMASPHVSGLAGLLFAIAHDDNGNGRLNDEVRDIIESTCDDVGIGGIGHGRINAYRAVASVAQS